MCIKYLTPNYQFNLWYIFYYNASTVLTVPAPCEKAEELLDYLQLLVVD